MDHDAGCMTGVFLGVVACVLVMVVGFLFHIGWNWLDAL